jgi:hypothetical protein
VQANGGIYPLFLTSAIYEVSGQLHAPATLPPEERAFYYIGDWLDRTVFLDAVEKRKSLAPTGN